MSKLAVLALFVSLLTISCCTPTSISKRGGFRLCGARLVETLTMVCGGEFYGPDIESRSIEDETADIYPGWFLGLPASKSSGFDLHPRLNRRQMLGVVDECCKKPCSFSVLSSYCGK